ncbi:MAG: hypothetical protein HY682_02940 [Chloroflexi bacterium]|nr:hypothetical protein [Chloroflexota bacterium]
MANYYFERECRTASSECYTFVDDGSAIGGLDIDFTPTVVHATLAVSESLTQEQIQELIEIVDEDIVDAVGVDRDEFIVHVHQGRDLGVYSNHEFGQSGNGHPNAGA